MTSHDGAPPHAPEAAFVHSRSVRLHVDVQGPRRAPLVLLIHGWGGGAFDFAPLMEQLSGDHLCVAAVDLRGYGRSDKTPRGYDLTTAASDMAGAIRGLGQLDQPGQHHGLHQATAVGKGDIGVEIGTAAQLGGEEAFPRQLLHGRQQARIHHLVRAELAIDHLPPRFPVIHRCAHLRCPAGYRRRAAAPPSGPRSSRPKPPADQRSA